MQLKRPFYIFSLLGLAIRPDRLEADRCRLLTIQRSWITRSGVVMSALLLLYGLFWLYRLAPIAAGMTPFAQQSRAVGWGICAISFFFANLFTQVPMTVLPLLVVSPEQVSRIQPYTPTDVRSKFTLFGWRVARLLPNWQVSPTTEATHTEAAVIETVHSCPEGLLAPANASDKRSPPNDLLAMSSTQTASQEHALTAKVANSTTLAHLEVSSGVSSHVEHSGDINLAESPTSQELKTTQLT